MTLGFPAAKIDVDSRSASLALQLRDTFVQISNFNTWLTGTPDATLVALGYTQAEVTTLKAAMFDLNKLYQVSTAAATQAAANDFWFNAKNLLNGR